ncbi:841_t:CDS:2 [Paraglomus occultum]|uniref:Elongation of fatty acids protein n=1 Tax=Paraglomus occultum TaxID=144539 RepID=A0A9N9FYF3_9GLOM|nr:841_t:CDS:2 [Paraglomus occultum]
MSLQSRIDAFLESLDPPPPPQGIPFPHLYPILMDWRFPLSVAVAYILSILVLNPKSSAVSRVVAKSKGLDTTHTSKKSGKRMTAALAKRHRTAESWNEALCDHGKVCWNESIGYWAYLFYLSKYYEIIDTIIILMKGRRSSFLQSYHHAGAIITMWITTKFAAPALWIFVVFNSFIHTIMYFYYALTSVGFSPPGKQYLTTAQILQFTVGSTLSFTYFIIPGCMNAGERFSAVVTLAYVGPLLYLFLQFAFRTYGRGIKHGKADAKTAVNVKFVSNHNGKSNGIGNGVNKGANKYF